MKAKSEDELQQEVQVRLRVSVTLPVRMSREELRQLVRRNVHGMFPGMHRHYHQLQFAEEEDIYQTPSNRTTWRDALQPEPTDKLGELVLIDALHQLRLPQKGSLTHWKAGTTLTEAQAKAEAQREAVWQRVMNLLGETMPSVWQQFQGEWARCVFVGTQEQIEEFMRQQPPHDAATMSRRNHEQEKDQGA